MMGRHNIHEQIQELAEKISRLNDTLKGSNKLHPVEIDLLKTYTAELDNIAGQLIDAPKAGQADEPKVVLAAELLEEIKEHAEAVEKLADEVEEEAPAEANVVEEKVPETAMPEIDEPEVVQNKPDAELSLNDRFKGGSQELAEMLNRKPADELRNMIDLSEKYMFINELFNGDASLFEKTLRQLNDCNTLDDAVSYLGSNIKDRFLWEGKEKYENKLLSLLGRRFVGEVE